MAPHEKKLAQWPPESLAQWPPDFYCFMPVLVAQWPPEYPDYPKTGL